MIDEIAELKERIDLGALVAIELGQPRKKSGRWLFWPCPFHTDHDPSFGVTSDNGKYKCFGCGATGDHVDFLEKRRNLTTRQALDELRRLAGLPDGERLPAPVPQETAPDDSQPPDMWQARARAFSSWASEQLWTDAGAPGLAYLRAGGLTDDTIRAWGLGWCPGGHHGRALRESGDRWGLDTAPVYLARGVVIPCEVAGVFWYVKIRRFDAQGQLEAGDGPQPKYSGPRGSKTALFGADLFKGGGRPLLLCEGERDTMLAWQELGSGVDVGTMGGAGKNGVGRWVFWLLPYKRILAAFDADGAGRRGAEWWAGVSRRVVPARVPHGNDLVEFHVAGGSLRAWLRVIVDALPVDKNAQKLADARDYVAQMEADGVPCDGYSSWAAWLAEVEAEV